MIYNQSSNVKLSRTSNIIPSLRQCQQRKTKDVFPANETILYNPIGYFQENFNKPRKIILNYLLALGNIFKDIYLTQSYIANKTGYSREYINRILSEFRELGLIDYNYRHLTSCEYQISSWFLKRETRKKLSAIFTALLFSPLVWLMPISKPAITQLLYKENIYNWENRFNILEFENFHKQQQQEIPTNTQREKFMEILENSNSHNIEIPDYIEELAKIFNLTQYGKRYVGGFGKAIVEFAGRRTLAKKDLTGNPWLYFDKLLHIRCSELNEAPNWDTLGNPEPITGDLRSFNKEKLKSWYASFFSISLRNRGNLANHQSQARESRGGSNKNTYCCGACEINQTQGPMKYTGKYQLCDKIRKENAEKPGYNSGGELFSEAKKNLYAKWGTLEGVKDLEETRKRFGYQFIKKHVDDLLAPEDHFPDQEPENFMQYVFARVTSPF